MIINHDPNAQSTLFLNGSLRGPKIIITRQSDTHFVRTIFHVHYTT